MAPFLRQTNFLGGELAPLLWGRNDLAVFSRALRTMRNFFPARYGAGVSRPGSIHIGTTRDPTDDKARLIPFVYSDEVSFCIEVGITNPGSNLYFRFFTGGEALLSNAVQFGGAAYELLGGITTSDLRLLKWAQTGDVLTLTHPDWIAQELRRLPDWDAAGINAIFTKAKAAGQAAALAVADGDADVQALGAGFVPRSTRALAATNVVDNTIHGAAWYAAFAAAARAAYVAAYRQVWTDDGGVLYAETIADLQGVAAAGALPASNSIDAFDTAYATAYSTAYSGLLINSPHWTLTPVIFSRPAPYFGGTAGGYPVLEAPIPAVDPAHPAREWLWVCTLTVQETATGRFFETSAWGITEYWDRTTVPGNLLPVAFTDHKIALYPDQPVNILRGAHLTVSANNLVNVGYREVCMNVYRGRGQLFGLVGTTTADSFLDLGEEPDYAVQPPLGTNPFLTTDYAGANPSIEHPRAVAFFQDRRVFLATEKRPTSVFLSAIGEYTNFDRHELIAMSGEALQFDLAARRYEKGIHLLSHQKLVIGTRSSAWSMAGAGGSPLDFDSVDAKVIDEVGMTDLPPIIVDNQILYGRAKGSGVRSLSFEANYGTYNGRDLSGQSEHLFVGDSVGFQGTRTTRELVDWTYAEDPWGLVWAVRADGTLLSLTLKDAEYGWARHDGEPTSNSSGLGPTYRRVCSVPEGSEDAVYVLVTRAIGFDANGQPSFGTTCVERMSSRVRRQEPEDDCCVDSAVKYDGLPKLEITTADVPLLAHLAGEEVWVVGVGNTPQGPLPVTRTVGGTPMAPVFGPWKVDLPKLPIPNDGGAPGLDGPHTGGTVVLYIGLRFTAELETLDIAEASLRTKAKVTKAVGFEVDQSRGVLVGQFLNDKMKPGIKRAVAGGYAAPVPETSLFNVAVPGTWGLTGRAALRQTLPLPVTVVALVREMEIGDE